MKRMTGPELLGLYKRGHALQAPQHSLWDEIAEYMLPAKLGMVSPRQDGSKRTGKLNDGTAPQALDDLAHFIGAAMTPAASPWLRHQFRQPELREIDAYQEWLEECTRIQLAEIARSNFYSAIAEVYTDTPAFGNGALQCDKREDQRGVFAGLHWEAIWLKELVWLPNQYGEVDTTFRCYERTALQWVQMFGEAAGEKVNKLAADKPEQACKFLHAVFPRHLEDVDWAGVGQGVADGSRMPYASVWVGCEDKTIAREGGYMELPRHVVKWKSQSGSIYGTGPGHLALPDVRTVNEAQRLELAAWGKAIERPMKTTPNNLVNGILDTAENGLTICRDPNALQPLYDATDFNLTAVKVDALRASILRTFYADLIREPGQPTGQQTAYEVARRIERAQRILGEAVAPQFGLLKWAAERSFRILFRHGAFPAPPQGLLEASPQIDVRFTSPLQQVQESHGVDSLALFLGDVSQLAQLDPAVLDHVDFDGVLKTIAERRGVPASALRGKTEVDELRSERAEAQALAQEKQDAAAGAAAAKDLGAGVGQEQALRMIQGGQRG